MPSLPRHGSSSEICQNVAEELKVDCEIVLAAGTKTGDAPRHAAEDPKGDREIVLAAGSRSGEALRSAAQDLKVDREIVLAAVSKREMPRDMQLIDSILAWAAGSTASR